MGLSAVPKGQVAAIVTSLEMLTPPARKPLPASPLRLERWKAPPVEKYRALFRRIGEPWLWFSRLIMDDARLIDIIHDERDEIYAVVDAQGIEVGILELDFREEGQCELGFFGLVPELSGKGHGRWLMAQAMALGWRKGVKRLWVHTCTLDSPGALNFYRREGFVPFARSVETFDDPRLHGWLPREAAPHIPIIEG
ncbi:GNAT family N-acetyltransferase [Sphingomonas sp. LaA6.9]|uniref:GNAT family N-acetyltransferase n=1 Tax=Sphingomonas sp. LaA6.9 TaxID=2919914 RepID=UPI001F4F4951|nr:GNAT family N-acetyltransferase [Sphingomonas sp. LaA6.9]MCJ8155825.1 GNAT family N-acetyltransferase [Sphingomonas sp. LaA6.9]